MPASVAAKLAGVRADSSIFYYLDGVSRSSTTVLWTNLYPVDCANVSGSFLTRHIERICRMRALI